MHIDAQTKDRSTPYDADIAATYAATYWDTPYGTGADENPFRDYSTSGGNCTNFASQAILAGLTGLSDPTSIFERRTDFDNEEGSEQEWYWDAPDDWGAAFIASDKLWEHAVYTVEDPSYSGLRFDYVTNDTLSEFMDYNAVEVGDIIFMDADHDGDSDHTMVVSDRCGRRDDCHGYDKIRVTYQNAAGNDPRVDRGLGELNESYRFLALFYVYRPVGYYP